MATDLEANLANYKLQLQQVEAALTTDPDNEELNKLKTDLQEVVDLTLELMNKPADGEETTEPQSEQVYTNTHNWKVGDMCQAQWSRDGMYYEATVDEILEDGSCTVTFSSYGDTEVSQVTALRPVDDKKTNEGQSSSQKFTKKDKLAAEREYKRKKALKKRERMKQLEEEKEKEKNDWKEFSSKTFGKYGKGKTKKSIFATPDAGTGRVGVGTCGISGKPMTKFHAREKWQK